MKQPKGLQLFIVDPIRETAWLTGSVITGLNFRPKESHVTLIVKAYKVPHKPLVAFITAESYMDCLELLYQAVSGDAVTLKWKPDKYAS